MKASTLNYPLTLLATVSLASWVLAVPGNTDQHAADANPEVTAPQSVFLMPQRGLNLRDPFFPNTSRFAPPAVPAPVVRAEPTASDIMLKAISGTAERPLAMINNRTLTIGEEAEVTTQHGRIRVRLIAVDGLKVTIGVGGETRELRLRGFEDEPPSGGTAVAPETVQVQSAPRP